MHVYSHRPGGGNGEDRGVWGFHAVEIQHPRRDSKVIKSIS